MLISEVDTLDTLAYWETEFPFCFKLPGNVREVEFIRKIRNPLEAGLKKFEIRIGLGVPGRKIRLSGKILILSCLTMLIKLKLLKCMQFSGC